MEGRNKSLKEALTIERSEEILTINKTDLATIATKETLGMEDIRKDTLM
jgi:hypothetical protein